MVSVQNVSVEFAARPLFRDANFVVNKSDRIALVGKNGAGKSTLLKIMAGLQAPTSGNVAATGGMTVGYLPQVMTPADDTTLLNEVRKVFGEHDDRAALLERLSTELASRTDYDSEEYAGLVERMSALTERQALENPAEMLAEAERTLIGLGFERSDFGRPTSEFSGGWRMRIELAKILLRRPDLLLLDEPTNHLDIESIEWLEGFLTRKAGAVMLVSHDKAFIDNVTNRTIEISCGRLYDYRVNYSRYLDLRAERMEQQLRAYANQQKEIADIKAFIERFRYKPTKAVQVQSRIKQLEKIVPIEVDEVDNSALRLKFPPAPRSGDFPLRAEGVGKSFGSHVVLRDVNLTLRRGEKVAFVGKNGQGKSTLVKCIMGELEHEGSLTLGHNTSVGYFAQNQAQLLDGELTVYDTVERVATGDIRTRLRDLLGAFMFGGEAADKKVKVLSGGEKTRLAMIRLLLEPKNFLILDEPTNHLDIKTKQILKDALRDFEGTVIAVSHDRDFLDGLVDKVYEFSNGHVRENIGGIYDYLSRHHAATDPDAEMPSGASAKSDKSDWSDRSEKPEKTRLSYAEQREREKTAKRLRKRVEEAECAVSAAEEARAAIEAKIAGGASDADTLAAYDCAVKNYENCMSIWMLAQEEADAFGNNL